MKSNESIHPQKGCEMARDNADKYTFKVLKYIKKLKLKMNDTNRE